MPRYDLDGLGDKEFEHLSQSIVKAVIGNGTITFGEGPDGGREATFRGTAAYPSPSDQWSGFWIFQAKFHNTKYIGLEKAREAIIKDLKNELNKIVVKYKKNCDNYILITNVPLSSVNKKGTHDLIDKVIEKYKNKFNKKGYKFPLHINVWGADELHRFLEIYGNIRQAYLSFITPGDLIAELRESKHNGQNCLADTIRMYISTCLEREQYAQLDQAGDLSEEKISLKKVFVDLDISIDQNQLSHLNFTKIAYNKYIKLNRIRTSVIKNKRISYIEAPFYPRDIDETTSAMEFFLEEKFKKLIVIGGPGQGKSTLCQYLAQIHRATLINELGLFSQTVGLQENVSPLIARIPFRIILKEYTSWITNSAKDENMENFIANKIKERTSRILSAEEIQSIFKKNPCLLILDGLDEVTESDLQDKILGNISEFLIRCEKVLNANLQVIATSRPTGYRHKLETMGFLRVTLANMNKKRVQEYAERWKTAKLLDEDKSRSLLATISECLEDPQIQPLTNTPLQVTILILIILTGGTPPRQREALFNEYLDIIYRREKTKAKWIMQTEKRLIFGLHNYLGYILHLRAAERRNVRSTINEEEFIKEIRNYVSFNDKCSSSDKLDELVQQIVKESRERLVLIVELEPKIFGFELRSLQEYFAAAHLADTASGTTQRYKRFKAIARPDHWRNVALLFAGRVGRSYSGEASNIIEICKEIDRAGPDVYLKSGGWLGFEIAADRCFVPNRNLQRSILEYSLSILDENVFSYGQIIEALKKLQIDDLNDHVKLILEDKFQKSSSSTVNVIADVYNHFFSPTEKLLNLLSDKLSTGTKNQINGATKKALEYMVPVEWLNEKMPTILTTLTNSEIVEAFAREIFNKPDYMKKVLNGISLNDEIVTMISDQLLSNSLHLWYSVDKPPMPNKIDISSIQEQIWLETYLLRIYAYSRRQSFELLREKGFIISEKTNQPLNELNTRAKYFVSVSKKCLAPLSEELNKLIVNKSALSKVKLLLWLLRLVDTPYKKPILEEFTKFYLENIKGNPKLDLYLYDWMALNNSIIAFPIKVVLELQKKLGDINKETEKLYNSKSGLIDIRKSFNKKNKLNKNEILNIISSIKESLIKEDLSLNVQMQILLDTDWNVDPELISKLDLFLEKSLESKITGNNEFLCKNLFWKLLKLVNQPELTKIEGVDKRSIIELHRENHIESTSVKKAYEISKSFPENIKIQGFNKLLFKLLEQIGNKDIIKYPPRNLKILEAATCLFVVRKSLGSLNKNVNKGAMNTANELFNYIDKKKRPWDESIQPLIKKMMKLKINNYNKELKDMHDLKLLPMAKVDLAKMEWIIKSIKESTLEEASIWALFIRNCQINDTISINDAFKILERIISERTINRMIREASLETYTKLQRFFVDDKINEEELDLPLLREN